MDGNEVVIRMDRRRIGGALVAGSALLVVGAWIVAVGGLAGIVLGVVCLSFFGLCSLGLVAALARPPVVLAIGGEGVRFGGLIPSMRFQVPWNDIRGVRIYRLEAAPLSPGMRMLGFVPADPTAPVWKRRLSGTNRRMTGLPVSISGSTIAPELEQVVENMRRFRPELTVEYGEPRAAGLGRLTRPSTWRRRS